MTAAAVRRVVAVVPAHDEAEALPGTLASLRAQTRPVDRVLVVSDNSTDRTVEVARSLGADVLETLGNTGRKAGALNQALEVVDAENVLVLDADTSIAPTFVEEGLALLDQDPALGAVGGVFRGTPPRSLLEQLQSNEYERYAVQIDTTGRTAVLTGTAALIRTEALADVARHRGGRLPGPPGAVYDPGAITEDSELTLALRTLGYGLASPLSMSCTTELMPTARDLHRQRVRWYKGMLDNLRGYGFTRVTARYVGQQVMLLVGALMLASLVVLTAVTVATGTFGVVPFWLGVGAVLVAERLVTVWRNGPRARFLAALVLPELAYDLFLQAAYVRACLLTLTGRDVRWNHVRPDPSPDDDRPEPGGGLAPDWDRELDRAVALARLEQVRALRSAPLRTVTLRRETHEGSGRVPAALVGSSRAERGA
ncbi:glycosyltransferase family 2 protein [Oerskovia sp. Sa1BUA8]|uniref:Glycosyltransferase family 2 protein n=1 Tax=Oerskovia douganii TaxID=2762210 RepID=A0A9D5U7D6_9CELL|nr:glycosyltransferase family 2 protein [Oerskovia douganii]MBE7699874.1 glycosyltransferase family 2 protein [Oerskovia douganii]